MIDATARGRVRLVLAALLLAIGAIGAGGAGAGCSSPTHGERMIQGFQRTRDSLADAHSDVAITLASLARLRANPGGDLERLSRAFGDYKQAVERLEKQAADAKSRAAVMQDEADRHM